MLTIVIPASNEERLIGACLAALAASDPVPCPVGVIVVANGCRDATAVMAERARLAVEGRGWSLTVLDLAKAGKIGALNAGDRAAPPGARVYLDADVTVSPPLLAQLGAALDRPGPVYASGRVRIVPGPGLVSRGYAAFWRLLPFMAEGVPGCGLFAVNAEGRTRWRDFPQVISDDTYVRLLFAPHERVGVPAPYDWPIADGFGALVRVRRRQDAGVAEIAARYPDLVAQAGQARPGLTHLLRLALAAPLGFAVYAAVALAVRTRTPSRDWSRAR